MARNRQDVRSILPKEPPQTGSVAAFDEVMQIIKENPPPHMLSITIMRARFLAYLDPMLKGSEKMND
jgi:hypothetical protein